MSTVFLLQEEKFFRHELKKASKLQEREIQNPVTSVGTVLGSAPVGYKLVLLKKILNTKKILIASTKTLTNSYILYRKQHQNDF